MISGFVLRGLCFHTIKFSRENGFDQAALPGDRVYQLKTIANPK